MRTCIHMPTLLALLLGSIALLGGCNSGSMVNPSFAVTVNQAQDALAQMRDDPKPFDRPVLVIGGWANTALMTAQLAGAMRSVSSDNAQVTHVSMLRCNTFEKCRRRVIEAVDDSFGETPRSQADNETVEVDVIGFSMGGLVARYAAAPRLDDERRLNIRRLYTIGAPLQGAVMAQYASFERRASDMRCGSALLMLLNTLEGPPPYEIVSYVRLGDMIVGEDTAAMPGCTPWWVPNRPFELAHHDAYRDPRILADIARRLRGETPFTRLPATDLPSGASHDSAGEP